MKRTFGSDLTIGDGGCDTQRILPNGTPEEVRELVLAQRAVLAPSGGFVFQQVHNVMANLPAEIILAMYQAVREYNNWQGR